MQGWFSLLPPLVAIVIAVWRKEIILALAAGIWVAQTQLAHFNPALGFLNSFERLVWVLNSPDNARIILFSLLVGVLLALLRSSGGVTALVANLSARGLANTPRQAALLPSLIGVAIFIESNLSILTAGITARKLFDKFKLSRAYLAYLIDSTCSPIAILILLNAWGAFILAQIQGYGLENPVATLGVSIPLNFYPWLAIIAVFYTAITGKLYGPLRHASSHLEAYELPEAHVKKPKVAYMLVPIVVLIVAMVGLMVYTGQGNLIYGSGTQSALWAVSLACLSLALLLVKDKVFKTKELISIGFKGICELLPLVTIVLLSISLGNACIELGTGVFVSQLIGPLLPLFLIAPVLFLCAAAISFTTGTSWGTFALVIPIGMPVAIQLELPPSLLLAAILGGGIWGDHCSPISDSTLMSSIASGCEHLEHVSTQLPYALVLGGISVLLYLLIGLVVF